MISTPLRMEKPVRRPIVPPIRPNWASIVTLTKITIAILYLLTDKVKTVFFYSQSPRQSLKLLKMSPFDPSQSHHRLLCQSRCKRPLKAHAPVKSLKMKKKNCEIAKYLLRFLLSGLKKRFLT